MTMVSISTTKNRLSALLDQVRHGQRVLVTDRGVPVGMLVQPDAAADADSDGRIQRLRRRGVITGGSGHIICRFWDAQSGWAVGRTAFPARCSRSARSRDDVLGWFCLGARIE